MREKKRFYPLIIKQNINPIINNNNNNKKQSGEGVIWFNPLNIKLKPPGVFFSVEAGLKQMFTYAYFHL